MERSTDSSQPLVSIITPSFNQVRYIRETIESVLAQDYPHIEHIIVDGASTDGTVAILREYSARYPQRFRWISEQDEGQSDAFNKGLNLARGAYIGWQNSDDLYLPRAIGVLAAALTAQPDALVAYGKLYYADQFGQVTGEGGVPFSLSAHAATSCIPNQAALIRQEGLRAVGGLRAHLQYCMDYELWLRLYRTGHRFLFIPVGLAKFRQHEQSKTSTQHGSYWREKRDILRAFLAEADCPPRERDALSAALGQALIVSAVLDLLDNREQAFSMGIQEGMRLLPAAGIDANLLANTCLLAAGPMRASLGQRLTRVLEGVEREPHTPMRFREALLARYYAQLALQAGAERRRPLVHAYTARALYYDRSWVLRRREISTALLQLYLGRWLADRLLPSLRVARRFFLPDSA